MNKILYLLFAICIAVACTDKTGYTIDGTATNMSGSELFLEKISQQKREMIDTVSVEKDGTFSMKGPLEQPGIFMIGNKKNGSVVLHLKPGVNVTVNLDFDNLDNYTVSGSEESERFKNFNSYFSQRGEDKKALVQEYKNEKDSTVKAKLLNQLQNWDDETTKMVKEKIKEEPSALLGLLMIGAVPAKENKTFYNEFNDRLQLELPNSDYAKEFNNTVTKINSIVEPPTVGETAPDIAMANPDGEILKLSDLKGNYVLLDFWAAWCGPCRRENPNIVKAYNKYKDQGFEIFSVSLDKTPNAWVRAIEQDNLDWPYHVSDLKYWNNAAAKQYGVKSIPASFLLDKDGKVIATNLRGPALDAKLAQLFN